jgi:hypothetical protein
MPKALQSIELFFSYAHEDELLRNELAKHLRLLERQGVITAWHDRKIGAGREWKGQIDEHLNAAEVILLLISSDFLDSDYCYDVEMRRALERHEAGEARVIPVILRHCDWTHGPFAKLQALPKDARPVMAWADRDEAFTDVARGIRQAVGELQSPTAQARSKTSASRPTATMKLKPTTRSASPTAPQQSLNCLSGSSPWLLLNTRLFRAKSVTDCPDSRVEAQIPIQSPDDEAALRALRPEGFRRHHPISFAHRGQAFVAEVQSVETRTEGSRAVCSIVLRPESDAWGGIGMEASYDGISADQLATMRARLLLLDERPTTSGRYADEFLEGMVKGHPRAGFRIEQGVFPPLWTQTRSRKDAFFPLACLTAVFYLKASSTCEHILELKLGPIKASRPRVSFRGQRHKVYDNREPFVIEFTGECPLPK